MAEHELVSLRVQDCIGSRVVGDIRHIVAERDRLAAQLALACAERDKLQAFKDWVHGYLDAQGVPHGDPENRHQQEGCRIGARLDLLFAERDAHRAACRAVIEELDAEAARLQGKHLSAGAAWCLQLRDQLAAALALHARTPGRSEESQHGPEHGIDLAALEKASRPDPEQPHSS